MRHRLTAHRPALAATLLGLAARAAALDLSGLSPALAPCSDFYAHANARWEAATQPPPARGRIDTFEQLHRSNAAVLDKALRELTDKPALQTTPGLRLIASYFASGMDEAAIEARGLTPIAPLLNRIDSLQRREDLPALLALLARSGVGQPLGHEIEPERRNPGRYLLSLEQAGLGLPDRDDYFRSDEAGRALAAAYRGYAAALLAAAGRPADDAAIDALMAFETRLADASRSRAALQDPRARDNPRTPAELAAAAPGLDWPGYLTVLTAGARPPQQLNVGEPEFAARVATLAAEAPLDVWRRYLAVRVLDAAAPRLPQAWSAAWAGYHGQAAALARSEAVIQAIAGADGLEPLAPALGELFAARALTPDARRRAAQLVDDLLAAARARVDRLDWMTPPARARLLDRLAHLQPLVGAPDKWPAYEGLQLNPTDYAGNWLRAALWHSERRMKDLDAPVDRSRWPASAHAAQAAASRADQLFVPAGLLQPPFFDARGDDAANYGATGVLVGHAIARQLDDSARLFDAAGAQADGWLPADVAAYRARADQVARRYGALSSLPGHPVDARRTLRENIADMAGLAIAHDALQRALKRAGTAAGRRIDGLTPAQRFFLSDAVMWRARLRPDDLLDLSGTAPHAPARYRLLVPVSNLPAFAQAFSCRRGDAMVAEHPITLW